LDNNIKFIIRLKGKGEVLDVNTKIKDKKKVELITFIRNNVRLVKCSGTIKKTVTKYESKKEIERIDIEVDNDCIIVTNLNDINTHTDDTIIELYRERLILKYFLSY